MYGLKVKNVDGQPLYLTFHICSRSSVDEMFRAWMEQADKLENSEVARKNMMNGDRSIRTGYLQKKQGTISGTE